MLNTNHNQPHQSDTEFTKVPTVKRQLFMRLFSTEPEHPELVIFRLLGMVVIPASLLLVWQLYAAQLNKPYLLPTVTQVLNVLGHPLADHYNQGNLLSHTLCSLIRVVIGFIIASGAGVGLGLIMGAFKPIRRLLEPTIELLRPLSPITWIPFAIAMFKRDSIATLLSVDNAMLAEVQLGMLFIIFYGALFPILINTLDGVASIPENYLNLATSLGAGKWQRFRHVQMPASLPAVITGLRQGLARCWLVIVAAEMLPGSSHGVGYMLMYAADLSDMACVVACMVIIGSIGGLLGMIMVMTTRMTTRWYGKD